MSPSWLPALLGLAAVLAAAQQPRTRSLLLPASVEAKFPATKPAADPSSPDSATPPECVEYSLSYPVWRFYDPIYTVTNTSAPAEAAVGDVQFTIFNVATYRSIECAAKAMDFDKDKGTWWGCKNSNLSFTFNYATMNVQLKDHWTCDSSPGLVFTGTGNGTVPTVLGCYDEGVARWCLTSNMDIVAELSTPVSINPMIPAWTHPLDDVGLADESCADKSDYPTWTVADFELQHHRVVVGGVGAAAAATERYAYYDVRLTVENQMNGVNVSCAARVNETADPDPDHVPRWVDCVATTTTTTPPQPSGGVARTQVMLDFEYGLLGVAQTYSCVDGAAAKPWSAVGLLPVRLHCGAAVDVALASSGASAVSSDYNCTLPAPVDPLADIPGLPFGAGFGDSAPPPEAEEGALLPTVVAGYLVPAPPMPHTRYMQSCTLNSFNATGLVLADYALELQQEGGKAAAGKLATFVVHNPGSGDDFRMPRVPVVDDGAWRTCEFGEGNEWPWQLVGCKYMLDRGAATKSIGFELAWLCDDRDPKHAVLFNATASAPLPAETCSVQALAGGNNNATVCHLSMPAATGLQLPLAMPMQWTSTGKKMDKGPLLPWV